jgi:hypothetical protein
LKEHLHYFSKTKRQEESQNSRIQKFSYYFCRMIEGSGSRAGSGSGSIPLTSGSGSGTLTDSIISCLPSGSMKFIWCNMKISYHTVYPSREYPAVVCHLFLYPFRCAPTTAFTRLSNFVHDNYLVFLFISASHMVQSFIAN